MDNAEDKSNLQSRTTSASSICRTGKKDHTVNLHMFTRLDDGDNVPRVLDKVRNEEHRQTEREVEVGAEHAERAEEALRRISAEPQQRETTGSPCIVRYAT
jgi:hypothetical protein